MFLIVAILFLPIINGAVPACESSSARSCDDCMSIHPDCVWITSKNLTANESRCTVKGKSQIFMSTINGGKTHVELIDDQDFRLPKDATKAAIQVRPQKIKLHLREGEPATFMLRYKALENYPLDIYYLVDQTYSMAKHLNELANLKTELADKLQELTSDFRIAFGYFSDKAVMPYYAMATNRLKDPCVNLNLAHGCVPGSNFVHELNFTNETELFLGKLKNFSFTANLDDPEGGSDALMQILLCSTFGWRMHSRKMIVLATDGLLHTAGDGLLAGVVNRAPQNCSMKHREDGRLVYEGIELDYPSVEELYRKLIAKKTSVLFAIKEKENNADYFKNLNELLHEVSFLAMMGSENNITEVLESGFKDAVNKVEFKVVDPPAHLDFVAMSTCNGEHINRTWGCWKVELEEEYTFNVTVTLNSKPKNRAEVIRIEQTLLHEHVEIEIEYVEKCECDNKPEEHSSDIHGSYECGVYNCQPSWVGEKCDTKCNPSKARYNTDVCGSRSCCGRGDFDVNICTCICEEGCAGKQCETQCPRGTGNLICSGHGQCTPGGCRCDPGYGDPGNGDPDCSCPLATDKCFHQGVECSNHGTCECGKCKCKKTDVVEYKGPRCEFCSGCQKCKYNNILLKHIIGQLESEKRSDYVIIGTDSNPDYDCKIQHSPNSSHSCDVYYTSSVNGTVIIINYYPDCYDNRFMAKAGILMHSSFPYILGVAFLFVLPLLVWKAYVTIVDRRIYSQFLKDQEFAAFQSNEIYKSPVTHYNNPMNQTKKES